MIEITKAEATSLADMIESSLFDIIRGDVDIDNMDWLCNVVSVYQKCKTALSERPKEE